MQIGSERLIYYNILIPNEIIVSIGWQRFAVESDFVSVFASINGRRNRQYLVVRLDTYLLECQIGFADSQSLGSCSSLCAIAI